MLNRKIVSDKSVMFALADAKCHWIQVAPDSDEYLKVWVKEPTWLEVDKAINTLMKINPKTQEMDIDLNKMYRYMVDNFITKTEPSLSTVDLIKLTPFVGNQIKEVMPNPFEVMQQEDSSKKGK
tara:strand:+ start:3472 stop:3843 length:372 start_codon:yes stop_codon:yes gene_type:complete